MMMKIWRPEYKCCIHFFIFLNFSILLSKLLSASPRYVKILDILLNHNEESTVADSIQDKACSFLGIHKFVPILVGQVNMG